MRVLSVDYGKKRTGLAVTDPLQLIANGLATVSTSELFEYLAVYIQKEPVERIVVGKPVQPNGCPSENMARVEQFVNRWKKLHPDVPISIMMSDSLRYWRSAPSLPVVSARKLAAKTKAWQTR